MRSRSLLACCLALVCFGLGLSLLYGQTSPGSETTTPLSPPPSMTPLDALLKADETLTQLVLQAQRQSALVLQQSADLLTLSAQLAASEASSATLAQQLIDSQAALDQSQTALEKSNDSLASLKASFDVLSVDYKAVREAADRLARASAEALKAQRAKLLGWQIAGIGGGAVGLGALAYLVGHVLGAW